MGYGTVLYCTVLYCTVLCCTVLYCTVLCCTVLYCTVLYCTVLYKVITMQISTRGQMADCYRDTEEPWRTSDGGSTVFISLVMFVTISTFLTQYFVRLDSRVEC